MHAQGTPDPWFEDVCRHSEGLRARKRFGTRTLQAFAGGVKAPGVRVGDGRGCERDPL